MMGYEKEKIAQSIEQNINVADAIDTIYKLEAKDHKKSHRQEVTTYKNVNAANR